MLLLSFFCDPSFWNQWILKQVSSIGYQNVRQWVIHSWLGLSSHSTHWPHLLSFFHLPISRWTSCVRKTLKKEQKKIINLYSFIDLPTPTPKYPLEFVSWNPKSLYYPKRFHLFSTTSRDPTDFLSQHKSTWRCPTRVRSPTPTPTCASDLHKRRSSTSYSPTDIDSRPPTPRHEDGRIRAHFIPPASVRDQPLQHMQVTPFCCPRTHHLMPREPIPRRPIRNFQMTSNSRNVVSSSHRHPLSLTHFKIANFPDFAHIFSLSHLHPIFVAHHNTSGDHPSPRSHTSPRPTQIRRS